MEYNTSTVWAGKVGTQVQQKLITKSAAKQTYLLTTKNLLSLIQIEYNFSTASSRNESSRHPKIKLLYSMLGLERSLLYSRLKSWNEHWNKNSKPKLEHTQKSQAQTHIRSATDHQLNHTSAQHPIMQTTTKNVTRQHMMIITWLSLKRTSVLRSDDDLMSFY